jgi:hypothetical protein
VWGETIAPSCPVLSVLVKPAGAKVLEGVADFGVHERDHDHATASGAASAAAGTQPAGSAGSIRLTRR